MTPRQKQRLAFVGILAGGVSAATALVLYSLEQNLLYFYTPSQIVNGQIVNGQSARGGTPGGLSGRAVNVGGIVVEGSVRREHDSPTVHFSLTDTVATVPLVYTGLLPDLFREGQGIVATGRVRPDGVFVADRVLAKHDENYMPPEVAEALEKAGAGRLDAEPIGVAPGAF